MKNALFLCALLVAASAQLTVFPTPGPPGKAVEDQTTGQKTLADASANPTPFITCDGTKPCRVMFQLAAEADLPAITGDQNPGDLKRYAKIDINCCVVGTWDLTPVDPACANKLTSESDWVEITGFPANPLRVALTVKLPTSNIDVVFNQIEKCQVTTRQRRSNVVNAQPVTVEASKVDAAALLRVDTQDVNAVAAVVNNGKLFLDVISASYQAVTITVPLTFHNFGAGDRYVLRVAFGGKQNVYIAKTAAGPDVDADVEILKTEASCSGNKCTLTFYAKRAVITTSAKFGVQQATTDLRITKSGVTLTLPITNSLLFAAAAAAQTPTALAPGAIISVNGETGVASQASLQNRTVVVESVHANNVPDDEYSGVSAGIVYAAVGSAFLSSFFAWG